jgi:hypothetical protein
MRMRIPGHRIVVLLGITLLVVLGCQTPPGPLLEGEGPAHEALESIDSLTATVHGNSAGDIL